MDDPARWPRAAASIAVWRGADVLLVKRAKPPVYGLWSLPGGHIEPGERACEAALRELREETRVEATMLGSVGCHDVIIHDSGGQLAAHYVLSVFCGSWRSGDPVGGSDVSDARFFSTDELRQLDLTDGANCLIHASRERYRDSL